MDKDRWLVVASDVDSGPFEDLEGLQPSSELGRGVYKRARGGVEWMAPLPYVHERIMYRDADGDVSSCSYLISEGPDSRRVLVGEAEITSGDWVTRLPGFVLSRSTSIVRAAATAIQNLAKEPGIPVREAIPVVDPESGLISIADHRSLPAGYLRQAPNATAAPWRASAGIVARSPLGLALAFGAAVFGPFLGPLRRQPFVVDIFGEQGQGKGTALHLGAAVWGNPGEDDQAGAVASWDITTIALGRRASELGILPVFMDEHGIADMSATERARFVLRICESGGARGAARRDGPGFRQGRRWRGVFFTTGNDAFLEPDAAAGKLDGAIRRTISLPGPLTARATDAEEITEKLIPAGYGWLGHRVLERFSVDDVRALVADAETALGLPEETVARSLTRHLAGAVAGAKMADQVLGIDTLYPVTLEAARAYLLEYGRPPRHDADRLIDLVRASIAASPAMWPYEREVAEIERPRPDYEMTGQRSTLPQRGVNASAILGIRADDDTWIHVLPSTMAALIEEHGLSRRLLARRLYERGQLHVSAGRAARSEWVSSKTVDGKPRPGYLLTVSPWPDPDDEIEAPLPVPSEPDPVPPSTADLDPYAVMLEALQNAADMAELSALGQELALMAEAGNALGDVDRLRKAYRARAAVLRPAAPATPGGTSATREAAGAAVPRPRRAARSEPGSGPAGAGPVEPRPREARWTSNLALTLEPVEEARAAWEAARAAGDTETEKKILDSVKKKAIPTVMAILTDLRENARYELVKFPPLPDELKKPTRTGADQVWESRPNWQNPDIPGGTMVDPLDLNGSYLSSFITMLPNGKLTHSTDGEYNRREPGIHEIDNFDWPHTHLPHPLGTREESGRLWVPTPTVKLLVDLATETTDRPAYLPALPKIHQAWTCGGSEVHLADLKNLLAKLRADSIADGDILANEFLKSVYSKFVSTLGESASNRDICRPDMMHIIRSQAYANLWSKAERAARFGLTVAKVTGTDELHLVGDWRSLAYPSGKNKGKPVFPEGRALGQIKLKEDPYPWVAPRKSRSRKAVK